MTKARKSHTKSPDAKSAGISAKNLSPAPVHPVSTSDPVILLFDEADDLFSKRSEVKNTHDKYGKS